MTTPQYEIMTADQWLHQVMDRHPGATVEKLKSNGFQVRVARIGGQVVAQLFSKLIASAGMYLPASRGKGWVS